MNRYIWTIAEIHACPAFGKVGWFYGLVRPKGGGLPRLAEVFPGFGYASVMPWRPRSLRRAVRDIRRAPHLKDKYLVGDKEDR